ncbi:MAG TPA: TetR family transcriptional regulator [Stellaceae bacterium]|jgi:TetR/AcrR family transcriptional repressor of nem operon
MPRPREFDPDLALERAMQTFWSQGYESTSLDDLCDAMALSRSSLYAAFGDKRALLLRALTRYTTKGTARFVAILADRPIRDALAMLFDELIGQILADSEHRGCFIGNCTAELARDDEAMAIVRGAMRRNEDHFRAALEAAQARGEIQPGVDATALARFLFTGLQGFRLLAKADPDRARLRDVARVMLTCLDVG